MLFASFWSSPLIIDFENVCLSLEHFIDQILRVLRMEKCNSATTPTSDEHFKKFDRSLAHFDTVKYQGLMGAL